MRVSTKNVEQTPRSFFDGKCQSQGSLLHPSFAVMSVRNKYVQSLRLVGNGITEVDDDSPMASVDMSLGGDVNGKVENNIERVPFLGTAL